MTDNSYQYAFADLNLHLVEYMVNLDKSRQKSSL